MAGNNGEITRLAHRLINREREFTTVKPVDDNPHCSRVVQQVLVNKPVAIGVKDNWRQGNLPGADRSVVVDAGKFNNTVALFDLKRREARRTTLIVLISVRSGLPRTLCKPPLVVRGIRGPAVSVVTVGVARIPFLQSWNPVPDGSSPAPPIWNGWRVIKVEERLDVGTSVPVAIQDPKVLLTCKVQPVDHPLLEERVKVGGVVSGVAGDLIFPGVVPIRSTHEKDRGRRAILRGGLKGQPNVVELSKRWSCDVVRPGITQGEMPARNGDAVLRKLFRWNGLVEWVRYLDGNNSGSVARTIEVPHAFLIERVERLDRRILSDASEEFPVKFSSGIEVADERLNQERLSLEAEHGEVLILNTALGCRLVAPPWQRDSTFLLRGCIQEVFGVFGVVRFSREVVLVKQWRDIDKSGRHNLRI